MSTTITARLNKAANQFAAGESTGFGLRMGVKYQDPKTKQDEWCNYETVIFAKSPAQIQFYQSALVEGSVVEILCEKQSINQYQGQNGLSLSINMLNARLCSVNTMQERGGQSSPQVQSQPNNYNTNGSPKSPQQMQGKEPADNSDYNFDDTPF